MHGLKSSHQDKPVVVDFTRRGGGGFELRENGRSGWKSRRRGARDPITYAGSNLDIMTSRCAGDSGKMTLIPFLARARQEKTRMNGKTFISPSVWPAVLPFPFISSVFAGKCPWVTQALDHYRVDSGRSGPWRRLQGSSFACMVSRTHRDLEWIEAAADAG